MDLVKGEEIYYTSKYDLIEKPVYGVFHSYEKVGFEVPKGSVWAYWNGNSKLGWMPREEVFRVKPKKIEYNNEEWV